MYAFSFFDLPILLAILYAWMRPDALVKGFSPAGRRVWRPRVRPLAIAAFLLFVIGRLAMADLFPWAFDSRERGKLPHPSIHTESME